MFSTQGGVKREMQNVKFSLFTPPMSSSEDTCSEKLGHFPVGLNDITCHDASRGQAI